MNPREFLGTGWRFPIQVDARGALTFARAEESIEQSIWIALGTRLNERQMLPSFGCGLSRLVFGSNDVTTRGNVAREVREALARWEPRIDVVEVRADAPEPALMLIRIDYRVRATNAFHNLVYPYYIREGRGA
jgi:phage baseplate assembly protein W